MFNITQLVGVPQLGVLSTLERLSEVFQEAASIQGQRVPVVSVYLKSGQYIQGYLICFNSGPEKKSVLIANYRATDETAQDLTYVLVDEISGLTVHECDSIIDHLSSGQINISLKVTPSLKDVNNHLQSFVKDFNARMGAQLSAEISTLTPISDPELEAIYFCVTDWTRAIRKHGNDEIAAQAFKDNAYKFIFKIGNSAKIENLKGNEFHLIVGKIAEKNTHKFERVSRFTIEATLKEFV